MSDSRPITKRFTGPCVRLKAWSVPDEKGHRSSIQVEAGISDTLRLFMLRMLWAQSQLTDEYLEEVMAELRKVRDAAEHFP